LTSGEFELIARYFKPLASADAPAFGLGDDAAVFSPPENKDLVMTKDALVAGVHFFADDAPDLVARKAVRVNISDLAAMGAMPYGYLLALAIPKEMKNIDDWVSKFARGLAQDQEKFNWSLIGGDTVSTTGPLSLSVTAIGTVERGCALKRAGAQAGDQIYVSGSLGDSALGLAFLKGEIEGEGAALIKRYQIPEPRTELGAKLFGIATAAMDISDGLAGDLGHICEQSDLGAIIYENSLPLSKAAGKVLERYCAYKDLIWRGGDDYELLFTAPVDQEKSIEQLAVELDLRITNIGHMTVEKDLIIVDKAGKNRMFDKQGYQHF